MRTEKIIFQKKSMILDWFLKIDFESTFFLF